MIVLVVFSLFAAALAAVPSCAPSYSLTGHHMELFTSTETTCFYNGLHETDRDQHVSITVARATGELETVVDSRFAWAGAMSPAEHRRRLALTADELERESAAFVASKETRTVPLSEPVQASPSTATFDDAELQHSFATRDVAQARTWKLHLQGDSPMCTRYGGAGGATTAMARMINDAAPYFTRLGVALSVVGNEAFCSPTPIDCNSPRTIPEVSRAWSAMSFPGKQATVTGFLFSGRTTVVETEMFAGLATLGPSGSSAFAYAAIGDYLWPDGKTDTSYRPGEPIVTTTVVHELGHHLNSKHDFEVGCASPGSIMGAPLRSVVDWSQCSIDQMQAYLASANSRYISSGPGSPPPAGGVGAAGMPARMSPLSPPVRVYDSRSIGMVGAGMSVSVQVAGVMGIPSDVVYVSLSLVVATPTEAGFATVFPDLTGLPTASVANFRAGETAASNVFVQVGKNGAVRVHLGQASGHVIVDISAIFRLGAGGVFTPLSPYRAFDSRSGPYFTPGSTRRVPIAGANGVPASATGAFLNLVAVDPQNPGFLTLYPTSGGGCPTPSTSNVNYPRGGAIANSALTALGSDGAVCVYTDQSTHVIIDGWGYIDDGTTGQLFVGKTPTRVLDSRSGAMVGPGGVTVAMPGEVAAQQATAVAIVVTAVPPGSSGYVTVVPCGSTTDASALNFNGGARPNMLVVRLPSSNTVCIYADTPTHILVDFMGMFVPPGAGGIDSDWLNDAAINEFDKPRIADDGDFPLAATPSETPSTPGPSFIEETTPEQTETTEPTMLATPALIASLLALVVV